MIIRINILSKLKSQLINLHIYPSISHRKYNLNHLIYGHWFIISLLHSYKLSTKELQSTNFILMSPHMKRSNHIISRRLLNHLVRANLNDNYTITRAQYNKSTSRSSYWACETSITHQRCTPWRRLWDQRGKTWDPRSRWGDRKAHRTRAPIPRATAGSDGPNHKIPDISRKP